MVQRVQREPFGRVISRIYGEWIAEQPNVTPGGYDDHEHSHLLDSSPTADDDRHARTINALRAAGYGPNGRPIIRISHQQAKTHANDYLLARGSSCVAGTASRLGPVWVVSEVDPASPDEMLMGGALAVFDDGMVFGMGSLSPRTEVEALLDRLDPFRRRLPLDSRFLHDNAATQGQATSE